MIYTTLNKIKEHDPCCSGWRKLLGYLGKTDADDEPLSLATILESNGLDDALWALRCWPEYDREWRLLACDFAEQALPIFEAERPDDGSPRNAVEVSRRYADGNATYDELADARDAAWDAAWPAGDAAQGAAWSAAWAAARDAVEDAARDAARGAGNAARTWQEQRLLEVVKELDAME